MKWKKKRDRNWRRRTDEGKDVAEERGMEEHDRRGEEEREEQKGGWHSVCSLAGGLSSSRTMDCLHYGS